MSKSYKRGEVYWGSLDPVVGSELAKTRPCIIISATKLNAVRRTVVIVPMTTTKNAVTWPLLINLPSQSPFSKVRTEQLRVVDKSRLGQYFDTVSDADLEAINDALKKVLEIK